MKDDILVGATVKLLKHTDYFSPGDIAHVIETDDDLLPYHISVRSASEWVRASDIELINYTSDSTILRQAAAIIEARGIHVTARKLEDMAIEIEKEAEAS